MLDAKVEIEGRKFPLGLHKQISDQYGAASNVILLLPMLTSWIVYSLVY